ncbi:MAG TPA: hypothetical protein VK874_00565, partial [Gaiellaceae bacterium]|nr:hypothetical protein [Gaiellaceae bacterium]
QRDRARGQENVERPRTDEAARSAEGREQPPVEPEVTQVPEAAADAPESTTPKTMHEDPSKLDQSGDASQESGGQESTGGEGSGGKGSRKGRS